MDSNGIETTTEKETAISTDGTKTITAEEKDDTKTINRYAVTEYFYEIVEKNICKVHL